MKKKGLFEIKLAGDTAEVYLYDYIGEGGVDAATFAARLKDADAVKHLAVRVNSPGGNVFDGQAIYNTLLRHPAQVTVTVDGAALSAASVVAMAGDKIQVYEGSMVMIHDPWTFALGNAADLRKVAESLDKIKTGIVAAYARHARLTADELQAAMAEETWYTAQEAVDAGLAHEVVASEAQNMWFDPAAMGFRHPPAASEPEGRGPSFQLELLRRRLELEAGV